MRSQPRVWTVLVVLLVSMTSGAIALMALGNNPPSSGPFCLSSYYRLAPPDKVIASRALQSSDRWTRIEIYFSTTRVGNIEWLSGLEGATNPRELNCHFVVCNGYGGEDGQIQTTERWQNQVSARPSKNWYDQEQTIRICVVADGKTTRPTDCQVRRVEALVETLCTKFRVGQDCVSYPGDMANSQAR